MTIDWLQFTPLASLIGGICIGFAALLLWGIFGKVFGISGILATVFRPFENGTKLALIVGLFASAWVYSFFAPFPLTTQNSSGGIIILAGLLVGFGTRLGSGCTSGHGVCGIARLSLRSLVATLVFILSGMITVYVVGENYV